MLGDLGFGAITDKSEEDESKVTVQRREVLGEETEVDVMTVRSHADKREGTNGRQGVAQHKCSPSSSLLSKELEQIQRTEKKLFERPLLYCLY